MVSGQIGPGPGNESGKLGEALHGLEGLKHMGSAIVPPIYDITIPHEQRGCVTEKGYELARAVSATEGLFIGVSSGAAISVALDVARDEAAAGRPAVIVALCPDGGNRYLSERFWEEGR